MSKQLRILAAALAVTTTACGKGNTCVPGMTATCPCSGGSSGEQTCLADGTFGACECGGTVEGAAKAVALQRAVAAAAISASS